MQGKIKILYKGVVARYRNKVICDWPSNVLVHNIQKKSWKDGYSGLICHITPCSDSPCLNDGECSISTITDIAKSKCNCKNGFHGEICQYTPCTGLQCGKYGNCLLDDESPEGFRIDFKE